MLNGGVNWMLPTEYDRTDIDGALRGFGYKIKGADPNTDDNVADATQESWDLTQPATHMIPISAFTDTLARLLRLRPLLTRLLSISLSSETDTHPTNRVVSDLHETGCVLPGAS